MKKALNLFVVCTLVLALFAGCGAPAGASSSAQSAASVKSTASTEAPEAGKEVKIGLLQLMEHPSLDEISTAITTQLEKKAAETGMNLTINLQNAQGDMTNIQTISQQYVADKVDLIIAVATPAAQGAAAAVEGTGIPVVFSAVTDPIAAELVESMEAPGGNITGTSDAIPVEKIFELAKELTPDAKSFGLIYNTSEVNSLSVIADAKAYLESKGMTFVEGAVTSSGDVQISAQKLLGQCDAIFAPIDNTVASAMTVLAEEAINAKKPVYVAADSMVADGGLATVGINYTNLGTQTADMAMKILTGTSPADIPVEVLKDNAVVVNSDTAAAIGVDVSKYEK